ncbi:MAG: site-2 protease family protein [Flavobacteriales bacterium]|nr:site-2 protease family protein [Flavobacteriales bacterium]
MASGALSRGALPLFTFKGIPVRLHWSFIALPVYIGWSAFNEGLGWGHVGLRLAMVAIVFGCVVLHEFGHALTARRFGVGTRDITLLPIGGVASLERMPEEPRQEFWITVAGPAVNLVIALVAVIIMALLGLTSIFTDLLVGGAPVWSNALLFLAAINIWLFLFNLIPAFPMDGGRILRSVLAMRMPRERATRIAAGLGRAVAIIGIAYALYSQQPFLALIGVFIFLAAGAEARNVAQREHLRGIRVQEVMRTRFWSMGAATTVRHATQELLQGGDTALIVIGLDGLPVGVLHKRDLIHAVEAGRANDRLVDLPPREAPSGGIDDGAHESTERMILAGLPLLPVVHDRRLVGALDLATLDEYMRLRRANESPAQN